MTQPVTPAVISLITIFLFLINTVKSTTTKATDCVWRYLNPECSFESLYSIGNACEMFYELTPFS
jgi:hypothetical protein